MLLLHVVNADPVYSRGHQPILEVYHFCIGPLPALRGLVELRLVYPAKDLQVLEFRHYRRGDEAGYVVLPQHLDDLVYALGVLEKEGGVEGYAAGSLDGHEGTDTRNNAWVLTFFR